MVPPPAAPRPPKPWLQHMLELWLFRARWLMAPIYVGLIAALAVLVAVFLREVWRETEHLIVDMEPRDAIVMALSLIDLSLAANLMLIVIFSGYEGFVSRIDTADESDRPDWMGAIDFAGLKLKLIGSIIAISAVALLRAFVRVSEGDPQLDNRTLGWLIGLHLVFLISGVMLALMDLIRNKARALH